MAFLLELKKVRQTYFVMVPHICVNILKKNIKLFIYMSEF